MLMRLDLQNSLIGLDGKEVENARLADLLANAMFMSQDNENALKFLRVAQDLSRDGYVDLDKSDLIKVKDFIKNKSKFVVGVQANLELALEQAEKEGNQE